MPISKIKTSSITADAASVNLNIDANTLFLDVANNRVGINTTSPGELLHINSTGDSVLRLGTTYAGGKSYNITAGGNGNYSPGVFAVRNVTDGTTPFTIYQDNVGIGTNGASQKLEVSGSSQTGIVYTRISNSYGSTTSNGGGTGLQFYGWDAGVTANIKSLREGQPYSPSYLSFETFGGNSTSNTNSLAERVRIDGYGRTIITGSYGNGAFDSTAPGLYFNRQSNTAETNVPFIRSVTEGVTTSLQLGPSSTSGTLQLWTAGSERARIESTGNFLIAVTAGNTGGGKLDLVTNSGSNAAIQARSVATGTGDGTTDVTVTRAVTNGASWWANARYDAYSHAWGYGGGATASTAMRLNGSGQLLLRTATATANTILTLDGSGAVGGADIAQIYTGAVKGTQNMGSGAVILHKLGQSQGLQFSGKIIANSWTGQAYIDVHIIARYTDDAISYQVLSASTLSPATVGKVVLQLSTVTISGVSGSFLAIVKNGGGTATMAVNGFCQNNVGFFYEVAGGSYTVSTTHATLN
jgi:hypothetical protein